MAAYRADIEIGVKGVRFLDELQNKLTQVSKTIDQVNKQSVVIRRTIAGAASATPMGPGGSGVTSASAQAAALSVERRVSEIRRTEAQASLKAVKDRAIAENYISGVISRRLQAKQQELATEQKITAEQQKQAAASARKRIGSAASNAIIGGAFPLLFGQGAGAALGGGLGGALGGAFGGTLGFGLSLVGTAIGQAIDDAKKLNTEINSLNNSLSSTGNTSRTTASDISQLAAQLGIAKDEAVKLVAAFSEFGSADIREALALSFGAVGGEAAFDALAAAIDNKSTLEAIVKLRDTITDAQAKEALKQLEINGAASANAFLQERLIQLQEQKLIKVAEEVTLMDRLLAAAAALGAQGQFIDPAMFGRERANEIRQGAEERKKAQQQALQDTRNFLSEVARLNEQFSTKTRARTGRKPPEDRTAALQADLRAIIDIGNAEDLIRDLRRDGRDLLIPSVELTKALADIDRDRIKQLERTNYETEKASINQIASARALNEKRKAEDAILEIEKQRAERYASVLRNVEYELQLTDARITGTEAQVIIEQKIADLKREQSYLTKADVEKYKELLELLNKRKDVEEIVNIQRQTAATGRGLRAGFVGPAGAEFESQLAAGKSVARATEIAQLTEQLQVAQTQARALESAVLSIGQAFGTAMTTGVAEMIKGTKTAQQVFAEFLDSVGSALLSAASQMIATYIAIGIARAFAGLSGGSGSDPLEGVGGADWTKYAKPDAAGNFAPNLTGFATGGFVTGPTNALIGEGGEPEYVIPASKMRAAMGRYAGGARGAAVIPGNGESGGGYGGGAGGGAIDVRYSIERINNVDYVTAEQFQRGMAEAAQQGAQQGETRALRRLQMSSSTRRKVGV